MMNAPGVIEITMPHRPPGVAIARIAQKANPPERRACRVRFSYDDKALPRKLTSFSRELPLAEQALRTAILLGMQERRTAISALRTTTQTHQRTNGEQAEVEHSRTRRLRHLHRRVDARRQAGQQHIAETAAGSVAEVATTVCHF